jgi:outer membrane receptor protein involved in Fe transport
VIQAKTQAEHRQGAHKSSNVGSKGAGACLPAASWPYVVTFSQTVAFAQAPEEAPAPTLPSPDAGISDAAAAAPAAPSAEAPGCHQSPPLAAESPATCSSARNVFSTSCRCNRRVRPCLQAPSQLKAVVVTAQRREESAQKVPTAVSVLSGENLEDSGIGRKSGEVLDYVPNASAATQLHARPRWWIRGVGTGQQQLDFANPVGFYLDDVYISNASATGFPAF